MMQPRLKRVYEAPSPDNGTRILNDRLRRDLTKAKAAVDLLLKAIAPSTRWMPIRVL